jgi:ABC-type Mn2+/Zn2+ transport system ATPase subunit
VARPLGSHASGRESVGEHAVEVSGLTVYYNPQRPALEDANFSIPKGAMVGILGPNGGGKSTLLKAILGLAPAGHGAARILGAPVGRRVRSLVGYVPQGEDVDWKFPVSAFDVAMMGRAPALGLLGRPRSRDRELAREALKTVEMEKHEGSLVGELSGGQQQRVFLARALAQEAEVLLLDEPVSGVDAPSQGEIFDLLHRLQGEGKTAILTSHDISFVAERCDLALLLNQRVMAFGEPGEIFSRELLSKTYGTDVPTGEGG